MIEKLKIECGVNVTNVFSKMFSDIELSKDMEKEFQRSYGSEIAGITFSTEILTHGIWPTDEIPLCKIPAAMKSCSDRFKIFYTSKHAHRRLEWLLTHGQCEIRPLFTDK